VSAAIRRAMGAGGGGSLAQFGDWFGRAPEMSLAADNWLLDLECNKTKLPMNVLWFFSRFVAA